jgi:polyisoprenoid-binding protein YceI
LAFRVALIPLCMAFLATASHAASRSLLPDGNLIEFTVKEMGVPVPGRFQKLEASIDIDSAAPEKSSAVIRIDIGSLTTGNEEADAIATGPDWLDKGHAPFAVFKSATIRAVGPGRYQAKGTLNIRNKERPIEIQFSSADQADGKTLISSDFTLTRTEFGIGGGVWNQPGVVAEAIPVKVRLVLAPAKAR